jgi:hypothetical protein
MDQDKATGVMTKDMSLVDRLRAKAAKGGIIPIHDMTILEAAKEIERLQFSVNFLMEDLRRNLMEKYETQRLYMKSAFGIPNPSWALPAASQSPDPPAATVQSHSLESNS